MEVIKPDKDEVDAFQTQRTGKAQSTREPARAGASSEPAPGGSDHQAELRASGNDGQRGRATVL